MNYHLEHLLKWWLENVPRECHPAVLLGHSENADVGFTQIQHAWQTGYRPDRHQCLHTIGGILQPQGGIGDVEIGGVGRKLFHQQNKFSLFWFTNIFSSLQMPGTPSGNETTCIFHFPDVEDTSKILHGVASALGLLTLFSPGLHEFRLVQDKHQSLLCIYFPRVTRGGQGVVCDGKFDLLEPGLKA